MPGQLGSTFVYGRLQFAGRTAISANLVKAGAVLSRSSAPADTVVVARGAMERCIGADGRLRLPFPVRANVRLVSERALGRLLHPPRPGEALHPGSGAYMMAEVARLAGLPEDTCAALQLFDVIAPEGAPLGYGDLAAARQVGTLMRSGVALAVIVRAAWVLAERRVRLSQIRLAEAPWGGLMQQVDGHTAHLDGQFALRLDEAGENLETALAEALDREASGDLTGAERLYRRAILTAPQDPLPRFNLGNVLAAAGRPAEAAIAFQHALARDPAFAEAAFNLAHLLERSGQTARARGIYRATVAAHPGYAQPLYNLARLLTAERHFADALPLWDRFIALAPADADIAHARKAALLCRMELRSTVPRRLDAGQGATELLDP